MAKKLKVKNMHVKCPHCKKKVKMTDMEVVEETRSISQTGMLSR